MTTATKTDEEMAAIRARWIRFPAPTEEEIMSSESDPDRAMIINKYLRHNYGSFSGTRATRKATRKDGRSQEKARLTRER